MKIFKLLLLTLLLLVVTEHIKAQSWTTISATRGNFQFKFPSNTYSITDTLNTLFYTYEVDSLISVQVHYLGIANINTTDSVWTTLLSQNNGDTLRAMVGYMLVLTNGQIASIQNIVPTPYNPKGIDFSIVAPSEKVESQIIHSRLYYQGGRFYAFTVVSVESDVIRLGTYKTTFFNSIYFAAP